MKLAVAAAFALAFGNAYAFHEGGVAYCDGCHTMHASEGGTTMRKSTLANISQYQAGPYLLQAETQSGACLNCHENTPAEGRYYISTKGVTTGVFAASSKIPGNYTPGGDFAWLKYTYSWVSPRAGTETGSRHGHSIVAPDFGYTAETQMAGNVGPGGQYPVSALHCSSCHDPHGRYRRVTSTGGQGAYSTTGAPIYASGSYGDQPQGGYAVGAYRILGGTGYRPMTATNPALAFVADPPSAVAPGTYNRSEAITQVRVAYGAGMSEWCANCHANIHNPNALPVAGSMRHPTGASAKLAGTNAQGTAFDFAANYNAYVKTGDVTGSAASSFLSLVQFETGSNDYTVFGALANIDGSNLAGPTGTSNVSCMSCHRAHASAFQSMTRWEAKSEFLTVDEGTGVEYADYFVDANSGAESRGKTAAAIQAGYNGAPATRFSGWQRSLCNKCHLKD